MHYVKEIKSGWWMEKILTTNVSMELFEVLEGRWVAVDKVFDEEDFGH